MQMVDLTIPIFHGIESYPGEPGGAFLPFASIQRNGFLSHQLLLYSHGGTHVDAPSHFLPKGSDVMAMPLEQLIGPVVVADVDVHEREIGLNDIHWSRDLRSGDRVLLRTGWGSHWGRDDYFEAFPNIGLETAEYVATQGVVLLGLDTPTPHAHKAQEVHEILLKRNIIIIEGLINLEKISSTQGVLICLPLPGVGLDGAPARVVFVDNLDDGSVEQ